jgi:NAD dependent epimerase/dehydratase family enzyme
VNRKRFSCWCGEQWQSWIHVQDLARIFLFIMEEELSGIFNGVAPNPVTNRKLVKEIAEVLDKPLILPNIPRFMMNLVLGEMSYLLFASQRVSSKKIEEEGFDFNYPNISSALRDIYISNRDQPSGYDVLPKEYLKS